MTKSIDPRTEPIRERETKLATLDAAIVRGLADAEAGRAKPLGEVFDRLERKYYAMLKVTHR